MVALDRHHHLHHLHHRQQAAAAAAAAASGPRRGQDAVDVTVINITTTVINDNKEHIK